MYSYVPQIIASAIAIVLLPLSKHIARNLVRQYGELTQKSESRVRQVRHLIAVSLNILFVFTLAVIWGVRPQNLLLGLSSIFAVLGVALFAQWSMLSNITAGVILFFTAPFRVGDRIRIIDKDAPLIATIENVKTFYVYIRTRDGDLVVLPNNLFLQKIVSVQKADGEEE